MTIRVSIKNEDQGETRIIEAYVEDLNGQYRSNGEMLSGGQSCELYVHSGQNIVVREVQNG